MAMLTFQHSSQLKPKAYTRTELKIVYCLVRQRYFSRKDRAICGIKVEQGCTSVAIVDEGIAGIKPCEDPFRVVDFERYSKIGGKISLAPRIDKNNRESTDHRSYCRLIPSPTETSQTGPCFKEYPKLIEALTSFHTREKLVETTAVLGPAIKAASRKHDSFRLNSDIAVQV